jgi:hypothetical protein
MWCLPGGVSADFVCAMEDVLEVYHRVYDPRHPVVCMDETTKQLIAEVKAPLPVAPGHPARYEHQYQRQGVANLFLALEPLTGSGHIEVTERHTKSDWALFLRALVDHYYPQADTITLVMDNLNTHTKAALYEVFPPPEAKRLADKLDLHYTPKHASWLNMAEIGFNLLSRQCLGRRIPTLTELTHQVDAWLHSRQHQPPIVNWQFTTADARIKLRRLYPALQNG